MGSWAAGEGHLEKRSCLNFSSMCLVPAVGWAALPAAAAASSAWDGCPRPPMASLQRKRMAGVSGRLPGFAASCVLLGSRWAGHTVGSPTLPCGPCPVALLTLSSSPGRESGRRCCWCVMATWDECCPVSACERGTMSGHGVSVAETKLNQEAEEFQSSRERGWAGSDSLFQESPFVMARALLWWKMVFILLGFRTTPASTLLKARCCWIKGFWLRSTE